MKITAHVSVVVALVLSGVVVAAAGMVGRDGVSRGRVDMQSSATVGHAVSARSADWRPVPGLSVRLGCPAGRTATATAAVVLSPGPAARLRVESFDPGVSSSAGRARRTADPGAIPVAAAARSRTVSFAFVIERLPGSHGAVVRLAWRSRSGRALELRKGSLRVLWDRSTDPCR